jgi:SAM-dependent methyltransferase
MSTEGEIFHKKVYWINNTDFYKQPYLRLEKCAKIVNHIARGREYDLLDLGCGPATLAKLLQKNINYHGIDIAVHEPVPNLIERDLVENEIEFRGKRFDIIVAAGFFEYIGDFQNNKLMEIRRILNEDGRFIATYSNFSHSHMLLTHPPYNNIMSIGEFKRSLELYFTVLRFFPSSHNWICSEPRRRWLKQINMYINFNIPLISPRLAVNYFFICSQKQKNP